jgi:hypothetical protein
MRQRSGAPKDTAETVVKDIWRKTRRKWDIPAAKAISGS